jgi:hypothetical protein
MERRGGKMRKDGQGSEEQEVGDGRRCMGGEMKKEGKGEEGREGMEGTPRCSWP